MSKIQQTKNYLFLMKQALQVLIVSGKIAAKKGINQSKS